MTDAARGGRPRKTPGLAANASDASLATLRKYEDAITPVVQKRFPELAPSMRDELVARLAHELAAFGAVAALTASIQPTKRGPKPRLDHAVFASTVLAVLNGFGLELPHWENGREARNQLADFCTAIGRAAGVSGIGLSARTARTLLTTGFYGQE